MSISPYVFLPMLGAVYGSFIGAYIRSHKKTSGKRRALWISGLLLLGLCITALFRAFTG